MRFSYLLVFMTTILMCSGCGMYNDLPFADSIRRSNIKQIKTIPGKTTIAEVEAVLGKPDKRSYSTNASSGIRTDTYTYLPTTGWYSIELTSCEENSETDCVTHMRNAREHYFTFENGVLSKKPYTITRGSGYDLE